MAHKVHNFVNDTHGQELIAYPLTVEHLKDLQQRADRRFPGIEILESDDASTDFLDKIASGQISANSRLVVHKLVWTANGPIYGLATPLDSALIWQSNLDLHAYTVEGAIVEINRGQADWADILVEKIADGLERLKITLTLNQLDFDFMMIKLEQSQSIPPKANIDPAYFSFGILNFEFVGDRLCGGIEQFALKLPQQTIIIAS